MPVVLARKERTAILGDDEFWEAVHERLGRTLVPAWTEAYIVGAALAAGVTGFRYRRVQKQFDLEAIERDAEEFIRGYESRWWAYFEPRAKTAIRDALVAAQKEGLTVRQVMRLLEPHFGARRAKVIAATEMTNVFGMGATRQYAREGFQRWTWETSNDERVCPICQPLQGETFSIDVGFASAHASCRCWPAPAGDPLY